MKTRLVRIGNSRGVRIPKPLIEEAGLSDEVDVRVRAGTIVITPSGTARSGWAEAARELRDRGEDRVLQTPRTRFDEEEWEW